MSAREHQFLATKVQSAPTLLEATDVSVTSATKEMGEHVKVLHVKDKSHKTYYFDALYNVVLLIHYSTSGMDNFCISWSCWRTTVAIGDHSNGRIHHLLQPETN